MKAVRGEATYLLWIDCTETRMSGDLIAAELREKTGLYLSKGSGYRGGGEGFLRMNLACPRSRLKDGLARLETYAKELSGN